MVKIPTMYMPQDWYGSWLYDKYAIAKDFCDTRGLPFLDMVYDEEHLVDIDWQQDTLDGSMHLNIGGAEKVTRCIMAYLGEMNLEKKTDES